MWDATTGAELMALHTSFAVVRAIFSSDGRTIAACTLGQQVIMWESADPTSGYGPRQRAHAARKVVDKLHTELSLYSKVIDKLNADETLDQSICKVALQIANARLWEDEEKTE